MLNAYISMTMRTELKLTNRTVMQLNGTCLQKSETDQVLCLT